MASAPRSAAPTERPHGEPILESSGFFVLRTPLLPFDDLLTWSAELSAPAVVEQPGLAAALAADRRVLRERLRGLIARPDVREALFVASASLHDSLGAWLNDPDSEGGQKVERTLVRYLARMTGRATPFGLFAGCSLGRVGESTRLAIAPHSSYRRHSRLDMDYLCALVDHLARDPRLRTGLVYWPSSGLYRAAGRLHYAETCAGGDGRVHSYQHVAVEPSDHLERVLALAGGGARIAELVDGLIAADPDIARDDAEAFVGELIDGQLLVTELDPTTTGPEPIHGLVSALGALGPPAAAAAERLGETRDALAALDGDGLGADPARYRRIARALEELPARPDLSRLFQVDLVKPAPEAVVGRDVIAELVRGVDLLRRIAGPGERDALASFRDEFRRRYEGREVPLVEVLDADVGIGYDRSASPTGDASSLLEGLSFDDGATGDPSYPVGARHARMMARLAEAARIGASVIELSDDDLHDIARGSGPLPDALAVLAQISAASPAALAAGEFEIFIEIVSGPSGAVLLGRFCHADTALAEQVRRHLVAEEACDPDAVYAEIVHLPRGRIGNVLLRPTLRDHEIVYLGRSGAPIDQRIPITDLVVSLVGERIVLRSLRLGRRVVPRLTCAHDFSNPGNLPVYRFLSRLQNADTLHDLRWSWAPLHLGPALPRVTSGRLVLALARWRLTDEEIARVVEASGAERFRAVTRLRRARGLPRLVAVVAGTTELPVDLDNSLSVESFVHAIKDRREVIVTELFGAPDRLVVEGREGRFVHEIVVPLVRRAAPRTARAAPASPGGPVAPGRTSVARRAEGEASPVRVLPPGSDWLYVKFYTGVSSCERILCDVVAPVVRGAIAAGAADRWFFVRYGDPDWHLRLRVHGDPRRLLAEVLPALSATSAPLIADGRIRKIQVDTYEREVERYGGPDGIALAEQLFDADSDAAVEIIEALRGAQGGDARWQLALLGIDRVCSDFAFDLDERHRMFVDHREALRHEFKVTSSFQRDVGDRFRAHRVALEGLLHDAGGPAATDDARPWLAPGLAALARRSARQVAITAELRARAGAGRLIVPLTSLASSCMHMHANRLLRDNQRAHELVLYDFLARLYEGQSARVRRSRRS